MPSRRRFALSFPTLLLLLAVLAYAVYFSYLTVSRYAAFEARALDMGNLDQAIWNTAAGRWFHLTNQSGTVNRLSLHVEPILIPISWLYWLRSGPPTLLILQAGIVALGALPLYALARYRQFNAWAALGFAVAFLLNPSIQAANWLEFHPITLAPTFLMAAFFFLVTGRAAWFAVFAVLAAGCKEEVALLVFMLGLYAVAVLHRRRLGTVTMVLSALWAFIAVFLIQNTFAAGNIHWNRYAYLGESPVQMATAILTQPDLVLTQLRRAEAIRYIVLLLFPVAFTPLLAAEILALALPSLAINLLADFQPMHQVVTLIYTAPIVPFVMIGAVYGVARLSRWAGSRFGSPALGAESYQRWSRLAASGGAATVFAFALAASIRYGYVPWGENYHLFAVSPHDERAQAIIAQIPADSKVSAQDRLNPHVSGRETVYIFPRMEDADTVLVDVTGPSWPQHPNDLRATVEKLLQGSFGVAAASDGFLLLRKESSGRDVPDAFYTAWQRPAHVPSTPLPAGLPIEFADTLRLIDYAVATDEHGETVVQLYWQAMSPLKRDLSIYVGYQDRDGDVLHDTQYYPPAAVLWYPTSQWEPGSIVLVQTLPWTLEADQFALVLAVYEGETGSVDGNRLRVTEIEQPLPLLEDNTLVRLGGFSRTQSGDWEAVPLASSPPSRPLDVQFGESIVLDGVTIPAMTVRPGDDLDFTLHWHASQRPSADYTAFAHLLDNSGVKVAQLDWQPKDAVGRLPTSSWIVHEPVVDQETLRLPADLTPGVYRLIVGLYNWQNGERLPLHGTDAEVGDVVTVAEIELN